MKLFLKCFSVLFALLLGLTGCSHLPTDTTENSTEADTTKKEPVEEEPFDVMFERYFDTQREHRPTEEEMKSLTTGMPLQEVIDRIGKPHDFGPTSGVTTLEWEDNNGQVYWITVFIKGEKDVPYTIENLFTYGYIVP